ncbi:cell wall-binding repeat-containing protein [Herbiconiux liukaitaii]|uniref:cell wall-binding repeat-containing protein n=1 Tax=Herbiconiux liukaitaii TaxID=3342799 RepID=UPI0035B9BEA2
MTIRWQWAGPRRGRFVIVVAAAIGLVIGSAGISASYADAPGVAPGAGQTVLVSTDSAGTRFDAAAIQASVSADGRFVVFASEGLRTDPMSGGFQVYRKEVATGVTRLVSATGDGGPPANSHSTQPSISADGRYVAFLSESTNLDPHAAGAGLQVFVRDMAPGGGTRLVTVDSAGIQGSNGQANAPSIAGDGMSVVYESLATDLVAGAAPSGVQIYQTRLDNPSGVTTAFISLQDSRRYPMPDVAGSDALEPSSSFDGSVVAFSSRATNLTADSAGGRSQVFAHTVLTGTTQLVSAGVAELAAGDRDSGEPSITADGTVVVYSSKASNLTGGAAGTSDVMQQIFRRVLAGPRASTLVSLSIDGTAAGNGISTTPAVSPDGGHVAFISAAGDLLAADFRAQSQVVLRSLSAETTTLVSAVRTDPLRGGNNSSREPSVSTGGRFVSFVSAASELTDVAPAFLQVFLRGTASAVTTTPTPTPSGPPVSNSVIERIGGADRFAVSAGISAKKFSPGVPVAYVASGAVFPDALSGSAAAGVGSGPVLLVQKDDVPAVIGQELGRLKPQRIVVLGGTATVSASVQTALAAYVSGPSKVTRVDGADRYAVSAAVSSSFPAGAPVAYVASGAVFPDALSGSAAAGLAAGPVLLTTKDSVPAVVMAELSRLGPKSIVVLGGTNTVAESVVGELKRLQPATTRVAGADRFVVSAEVAEVSFTASGGTVYVASGQVFPDALSGSAAAIGAAAPVLLVTADTVPPSVAAQLTRLKPTRIVVLGGASTISEVVYEKLRTYLAS